MLGVSNLLSRAAQYCPKVFVIGALALSVGLSIVVEPARAQTQLVVAGYSPRPIEIGNDLGGDVGARANRIAAMKANGQSVAIRGPSCYSACTMYLALPGSCVSRNSRFGFHRPSFYGSALSPEKFEFWSQVIASHYPASLQSWYLSEGRYSARLQMVAGADIIRLGVPECS